MAKNVPLTRIAIKPATKLIFLMSVFYSITLILIFCCDIAWYLKVVLCLMILMNGRIYFQRHLLQTSSQAVISFWKTSADFWCLHFADSEVLFANLHFPCVVTRYITILKFYTEERKTIFVIMTPGCIGKNEYCKLCGYLIHS